MSTDQATQDVDEMDRDDLEAEVEDLRERVEQLERADARVDVITFNHVLERLIPDIEIQDYTADPMQHLASVEEYGRKLTQTVDAVEEAPENPSGDAMTDNWQAVVDEARRKQGNPDHAGQDGWVYLYTQDVADATSSSTRWGRELIEELGEDHEGAKVQAATPERKKALLVNLDVWGENA